ncbi:hypothetical protein DFH07DRAFT_212694 [Mycena maculata]|uniref:BTB domain-containing protein n=1 Tax=Mycena maculata TaxID=230809 RepID=A0AAD7JU21_9AGAR|nr:hypothetical protein DFH07DRAFT_212694 [Mycena maculata]
MRRGPIKAALAASGLPAQHPVAMAHTNSESLLGLQHFEEFYLSGGDLYCLVENKLFRIHRYFFERESKFFKAQLAVPATPGRPRIGTADDSAILLDNVRSKDFAKLLWVFYNPKYSLYDASVEDWSTILELAERWEFAEVKNLAVRELEKKDELPDIDRIVLYHKFKVDESYLIPRYAALCERPELLTVEEGLQLGMEVTIALSRARECARNQASSGGRSPSPAGLGNKELTDIIKDHFNIKPVEQSTEPQPPSPGKSDDNGPGAGNKTPGGNGGKSNANGTANGTGANRKSKSGTANGGGGNST